MLEFALKLSEKPWVNGANQPPVVKPFPTKPKLRRIVVAIPLSGHSLALVKGTIFQTVAIIQDMPDRRGNYCLRMLDGNRTWMEIASELQKRYSIDPSELEAFLQELNEIGVLEDGAALPPNDLTADDLNRYSRNLNCWADMPSQFASKYHMQAHLRQGRVLVLGVGGLGSNYVLSAAMLGVGHLILVDFDQVELQNLNRQVLYDTSSVGKTKVRVAADRVRLVNPSVQVTALEDRIIASDHVEDLIQKFQPQIIVLAADRPVARIDRWVNKACFRMGVPYITGGVSGAMGRLRSKIPGQTGCHECDQLWLRDHSPEEYEISIYRQNNDVIPGTSALGSAAQIIAGLIGYDVLRHLLGWPMESAGNAITVDFFNMAITKEERPQHPECPICSEYGYQSR
jgi:molybdopterin/thiamine biosynthesis adenylyltransferase